MNDNTCVVSREPLFARGIRAAATYADSCYFLQLL